MFGNGYARNRLKSDRKNCYDGVDEYYVVIRETGQRAEEESQEEIKKRSGGLEAFGVGAILFSRNP